VSPAYGDTTAAKRSLENFKSIEVMEVKVLDENKDWVWEFRNRVLKMRNRKF
jgi:hypothetical protein